MPCARTNVRCTWFVEKVIFEACGLHQISDRKENRSKQLLGSDGRQDFGVVLRHLGALSTLRFCTPLEYIKTCTTGLRSGGLEDPLSMSALHRFAVHLCARPVAQTSEVSLQNAASFGDMPTLHRVVELGQLDDAWAFVRLGSDVNSYDAYGSTPLHCAASGDYLSICRLLVQSGANIEAKYMGHNSLSGWTALHFAAYAGAYEVANFLLHEGADVNAADLWERTPFSCAKDRGYRADILSLLLEWGAVDSEMIGGSAMKFTFPFDTRGYELDLVDYD